MRCSSCSSRRHLKNLLQRLSECFLFADALLHHLMVKLPPHRQHVLLAVKGVALPAHLQSSGVIFAVGGEAQQLLDKAVVVLRFQIVAVQDHPVQIQVAQQNRQPAAHRLQHRHREQLVKARQQHDVAHLVDLRHLLPIDKTGEKQVFRMVLQQLFPTLVLMPLSKWFLSKRGQREEDDVHSGKSLKQLVKEYGLSSNLFRLKVVGGSRLYGKTIIELDIRRKYGLNILEVRRGDVSQHRFLKTITQKLADPSTVLQKEDILYVTGDFNKIKLFAEDFLLEMLDGHITEEAKDSANSLDFYDIGIAEIVLMPSSNLINQTIKGAGFRDKFNVNVLGVRRKKEYLLQDLGNERIHSGDVLLVQGTWSNIARLSKEDADWVVLGQPLTEAAKVTLDYKAPVAAVIMVLMVAMMVFDFIPVAPVTAVMIAGILMVLTGCFRNVEAAYKTINWESIVLIAAMLPMSLALEKTGASEYISNSLVSELGAYGPLALMAGIYFTTSLMTMFISNTATAVLLAPIAMQSASQIGVSPVPFLFAVTLGASMCFASPFSTPPNALVMPAGQYTFMDYVKVGLPLQVIMGIVMVLVLPLLFPF